MTPLGAALACPPRQCVEVRELDPHRAVLAEAERLAEALHYGGRDALLALARERLAGAAARLRHLERTPSAYAPDIAKADKAVSDALRALLDVERTRDVSGEVVEEVRMIFRAFVRSLDAVLIDTPDLHEQDALFDAVVRAMSAEYDVLRERRLHALSPESPDLPAVADCRRLPACSSSHAASTE